MAKLSVLLPTYNSQDVVRDCLETIKWADEILVVDSFSTDHTLEICREYGARILQHEYVQSAKQKNWAIPQCAHDWILQIDTDEILEPGLAEEIRNVLKDVPTDLNGFQIPFKNHMLGEWVTVASLYPGFHIRLFRRDVGSFEDKEVHARTLVQGQVGTLKHHILHFGAKSISNQLRNLDRYSRYQADELRKRGKHFRWWQLFLRPFAVFSYYYLWRRGFMGGYRGLLVAGLVTSADFWSHFKLWEIQTLGLSASPK